MNMCSTNTLTLLCAATRLRTGAPRNTEESRRAICESRAQCCTGVNHLTFDPIGNKKIGVTSELWRQAVTSSTCWGSKVRVNSLPCSYTAMHARCTTCSIACALYMHNNYMYMYMLPCSDEVDQANAGGSSAGAGRAMGHAG